MPLTYPLATRDDMQAFAGHLDWKGVIVWTSPARFLALAAPCEADLENVTRLTDHIRAGRTLDPLVLISEGGLVVGHEGRHRARACMALGILSVPVLVIPRDMDRVPRWTVAERATIDSLSLTPERH